MGGSLSSMGSKGGPEGLGGRPQGPATPQPWTEERAGKGVGSAASSPEPWSQPPTLGSLELAEGEQDEDGGRGSMPARALRGSCCLMPPPPALDPESLCHPADGMLTWTLPTTSLHQALAAKGEQATAMATNSAACASPPFAIPPSALPSACRALLERHEWCLVCRAPGADQLLVQLRVSFLC